MRYIKLIVFVVCFLFAILMGFTIKNFPLISWNKEIKIYEAFQILSTLFIATAIPFLIKKWIEDKRTIAFLLNEEMKDILSANKNIKDKITEYYNKTDVDEDDKQFILYLFEELDNLISIFEDSLINTFDSKLNSEFQDLKIAYYTFWKDITGGTFMNDNFVEIDLSFLIFYSKKHVVFQNKIRNFILTLQKK